MLDLISEAVNTISDVLTKTESRGNTSKSQKSKKESMVSKPDTVLDKWTMVIHPRDAAIARTAMVSPNWLIYIEVVHSNIFLRHFAFQALLKARRLFEIFDEFSAWFGIAGGRRSNVEQNSQRGEHRVERSNESMGVSSKAVISELVNEPSSSQRRAVL